MSVENIHEYVRRCMNEPELHEAAKGIGLADIEGHMHHADSLGLGFSQDDLAAFRRDVLASDGEFGDDDLTVEELERVAGGIAATTVAVGVGVGAAVGGAVGAAAGGGVGAAATSSAW